jgi:hypothetical protein
MAHTPGPWICDSEKDMFDSDKRTWLVTTADGTLLADCIPWERGADARLIAEAPELLEALRVGLEWSESDGEPDHSALVTPAEKHFRSLARAALNKAEGRSE